jgi:uncharacterized protein (UPF0335 family)
MRFDHWTKEKKQLLEYDYQQLFADQVLMMKKIYRFKSDQQLLDDILNNISSVLYNLLLEHHYEFVEELIERMFLSILPYDVISYKQKSLDFFKFDLYFYDQNQTISYRNIVVMSQNDLNKLIEMIMYIGRSYDQLSLLQQEDVKNINAQQLVSGFDEKFIKNNIKNLHHVFYIQ